MNDYFYKVEEIIELNSESASNYMSQARQGTIKIRGKIIRDASGKLRPVLVKTCYQQSSITHALALEPSWGAAPTEEPIKTENSMGFFLKLIKNLFK